MVHVSDTIIAAFIALSGVIFTILKDRSVRLEQAKLEEKEHTRLQVEHGQDAVFELVKIIRDTYGQLSNDQVAAHNSILASLEWYMKECDRQRKMIEDYRSWARHCKCGAAKRIDVVQSTISSNP